MIIMIVRIHDLQSMIFQYYDCKSEDLAYERDCVSWEELKSWGWWTTWEYWVAWEFWILLK